MQILVNPFRYRGYYYDTETGLYYLKSRYYDPETGRFINADDINILDQTIDRINGLNLYAYCGNNPVMRIDPSGKDWWEGLIGGIVGFIIAGVPGAIMGVGVGIKNEIVVAIGGTIASVGMIAIGIATIIASGGTAAQIGAVLIGAGVSSAIGGWTNFINKDGSFLAGWAGGAVGGAIVSAGSLTGDIAFRTVIGAIGGGIGYIVENAIDGKEITYDGFVINAIISGGLNFYLPFLGIANPLVNEFISGIIGSILGTEYSPN